MILLAVGPGPGALHAPEIIRELVAAGHRVEVELQSNAKYFVGPAAFAALAPVVEKPSETPEAVIFAPPTPVNWRVSPEVWTMESLSIRPPQVVGRSWSPLS